MSMPEARPPKLGSIDLNLLVVFDAIMQERSVTRAGHRLGLSQPAMSHALARLRHMLKDDLFVRSPRGMLPTPRAEQLALPIRSSLEGLQQSLEPGRFDPRTATRDFHVAVDNYAAVVLVGLLAARVGKAAPGVTLEFRPTGRRDIPDLTDRGDLDLVIGPFSNQGERFSRLGLLQDNFVAVSRKNLRKTPKLSIKEYATIPHLEITSVQKPTDFIDQALAQHEVKRHIALRAPLLSAAGILAASDLITVLPRRIAEELARDRPLTIRPLPHASPMVEIAMIWPRQLQNQPAHRWLRDTVVGEVEALIQRKGEQRRALSFSRQP
jgi:DNA-binding transcriptional LysR family regulator